MRLAKVRVLNGCFCEYISEIFGLFNSVLYWEAAFAPAIRATLDLDCRVVVDVASLTNAEAVLLEAIISVIVDVITRLIMLFRLLLSDAAIQVQ